MSISCSITIITRNRLSDLRECVASFQAQLQSQDEVVIVDNGSTDGTKKYCQQLAKTVKLVCEYESREGISYARNASFQQATKNIVITLDDDCVVSKNWLVQIREFFQTHHDADVLIGYATSYWKKPIPLVEQFYYDRWILMQIGSLQQTVRSKSPYFFDFKNAAIRRKTLQKMDNWFRDDIPYATSNQAGDEDIEFGSRLFQESRKIFFHHGIAVWHKHSQTLTKLFKRNFDNGKADIKLLQNEQIDLDLTVYFFSRVQFVKLEVETLKALDNLFMKVAFCMLVFVYPLPYRLGRFVALCQCLMDKYVRR